jgi:hydrogenase expression/formation protein HypD
MIPPVVETQFRKLEFRDPERAQAIRRTLVKLCEDIGENVAIMHVCGTHEQSIAKFGLRSLLPQKLEVIMGPGCPVCVTDMPEVDEAVIAAQQGGILLTFGDMFRVPGSGKSLAEIKAEGADVRVIYSPWEALQVARGVEEEVIFFATGFETTAVATAAVILADPPKNFSVLSAHKYIPPVMEIVAEMPQTRVQGFLAAGHAATITGWKLFERFVQQHQIPVVIGGFEPLDILAALAQLLRLIRDQKLQVVNAFPRCCTADGNLQAQKLLWEVFQTEGGMWRGIAHVPNGNLRLRPRYGWTDTRERLDLDLSQLGEALPTLTQECICGNIMAGISNPLDCRLFGKECRPQNPVGACMVSSEGNCRIWHEYGGHLVIREATQEAQATFPPYEGGLE